MTLNDFDREQIRRHISELKNAKEFSDKDYRRSVLKDVDNMPRELKIKMMADLCEYWESE